ncbi:GTP-binding protein [Algoriphagus sp. NG3]|uniref:CobW family GTP-binding protein n=1 Tax=Algoriphagus sp. NG3 TaxID=3097546 RepID=UPI002A81FE49|nr:GTP-binding protein [Algoriphagus sp. NG3]WPR76744.1 GTP-binding protein [Algoriphagus sp. NG3]
MNSTRIKVYLLTGFLGAGKTTVLNRFLEAKKDENNIVIENEFGKVSIDSHLVSSSYDSLFELNNGCICCTLDDELAEVLASIIRSETRPDNVFIEASGVADPGGIAAIFTQNEVAVFFDLQQILCVVDATCIEDWAEEIPEINRQLAAADVIVLNKKSSVSSTYLIRLIKLLRKINSLADILPVDQGMLPMETFDKGKSQWNPLKQLKWSENVSEHPLKSFLLEFNTPFNKEMLINQLTMTLFISYHQIYRIKGLVWCQDEKLPVIIQSHGKQVNFSLTTGDKAIEFPISQVVVIGKGLQRNSLEKLFKRVFSPKYISISSS